MRLTGGVVNRDFFYITRLILCLDKRLRESRGVIIRRWYEEGYWCTVDRVKVGGADTAFRNPPYN